METKYEPQKSEGRIYQLWLEGGFFNPDNLPKENKKPYVVMMSPVNITGSLHMGHALENTVSDILIRFNRLRGYRALFLPGTDHAGIATQNVVEKELKKEGLSRFDLGREKFVERVWQWKEKYGDIILDQLRKLGISCDWSRARFTMDKNYEEAVRTAFLHYHKKGWIYRGKRVVNWCPRCQTSLSDLELEYKEEKSNLWYIKYPLAQDLKFIVVATTRPETMLGDTAVAVNPNDKRYKELVGKKVTLPLVNKEIPIVADRLVDPEFGTGAVKVTPAHDLTDCEIGLRHGLAVVEAIDGKGRMTKNVPLPYQGLKTLEARQKVVEDLEKLGLLEKTEEYVHQVPKCYRCDTTVELIPSLQWFLKMPELAKLATKAVKSNKVKFVPQRWEKIYFDWLANIKDWCISRQLWWGHKIPIEGETDVLDTWFSSALWPFAALGWPKKSQDLKNFYPANFITSAREIINLWIARMIFSGLEFMGREPFKIYYCHATVLTREGKRMSKSLGTGIDPLNLIEKYGADATRFGIVYQLAGGQDIRFIEDNIVMGRKFANKIWNASRFVLASLGEDFSFGKIKTKNLKFTKEDKWIMAELNRTTKRVNRAFEKFNFHQAAEEIYSFFWHKFCDKTIEDIKKRQDKTTGRWVLYHVLLTSLKLLHPFMPFITEEIYQLLPEKPKKALIIESWPK